MFFVVAFDHVVVINGCECLGMVVVITVLLLNNCPFVVVVVIMAMIAMTTTNKGQFYNNKTVENMEPQFGSYFDVSCC